MRLRTRVFTLVGALVVTLPFVVHAGQEIDFFPTAAGGNVVTVDESEVINRNYYAAGSIVTIDGDVNGDVIVAGSTINISGKVAGDVIAAGSTVSISGPVGGDVRVAASTVELTGTVARNLTVFASSFRMGKNADVGWSALLGVGSAELEGAIRGHLDAWVGSATLAGTIGGHANVHMGSSESKLVVRRSTAVGKDLTYWSPQEGQIAEKATVGGEIVYKRVEPRPDTDFRRVWQSAFLAAKLAGGLGTLLTGLILILFVPGLLKRTSDQMLARPASSIGWGFLLFIVMPIAITLILVTVIGIPLGLYTLALYGLSLFMGSILAGLALGLLLLRRGKPVEHRTDLVWAIIVGVVVFQLLMLIPFLGWLVGLVGVTWGLGALIQAKRTMIMTENASAFPSAARPTRE
ncbi:MAG: polymer-forming cytoskeletal protein [Candidatus Kerfeldbacteria bacterium]|nr:polymer-forming cytoskeletal protein [Candidatus Kerfeldbacteria bacterium]